MAADASVPRAAGGSRREPMRSVPDIEGGNGTPQGPSGLFGRLSARSLGPCGLEYDPSSQLTYRPGSLVPVLLTRRRQGRLRPHRG